MSYHFRRLTMPLIFGAALLLIGSVFLSAPQAHAAGFSCVHLAHTLSLGSRDANTQNEVSLLQRFLAQDQTLYPEGQITGYFGPLTQRAVQRFQARAGIVNYGTPYTTGYGSVGVRTRAAIMQYCTNTPVYSDGMTVKDIDRIFAYINRETKTTDVDVIINNAPDISLSFDETAKSRITRALGEALEADHDFDFSEFSSDRSRDSRLSRLTDWTYEGADEDTDTLTIDDIRKIMVTEGDDYADVTVDLRDEDDLTFDIVEESQSKMVSAVAEKLENSFDMDFSEFSSDSKRDAQIKRLILWEDAASDASYTLDDVLSVVRDDHATVLDGPYKYTISLKRGGYRIVYVPSFGPALIDEKEPFRQSGYIGDVDALIAMAVSVTSGSSYALTDVKSVTVSTPTDTHISDPSSTYTITLFDGRVFTVSVSGLMTSDSYTKAFRDTGYTGDVQKLTALASGQPAPTPASGTPYSLSDVHSVVLDERATYMDGPYKYTIFLKKGGYRIVYVSSFGPVPIDEKSPFRASGYTGDIDALKAMATRLNDTFTYDVRTGVAPLSVTFKGTVNTNHGCGGTYTISFGDYDAQEIKIPSSTCTDYPYSVTHVYKAKGTYDAGLFRGTIPQVQKVDAAVRYIGDVLITVKEGASEDDSLPVSIEGSMYGGCRLGCPAFSLARTGEYTYYRYGKDDDSKSSVKNGTVSSELIKKLQSGFDATTLATNAKTVARTQCSSYVDGTDITYTVTRDGKTYTLDTCTTAFGSSSFQTVFSSIWTELFAK